MINYKRFISGAIDTNSYLLWSNTDNSGIIIDPSDICHDIKSEIIKNNLKIRYILITHSHADHIYGASDLSKFYEAPVLINENEYILRQFYKETCVWMFGIQPNNYPENLKYIKDNEIIYLGKDQIKCVYTPGHSKCGMTFLFENCAVCGDLIFKNSVGRTDLPTGNELEIINSIKKIISLSNEIKLLPGHGQETKIISEKRTNMFVKAIINNESPF